MHTVIEPKILYFGTSVVLISTINERMAGDCRYSILFVCIEVKVPYNFGSTAR
jgi:hypothetical protein